MNAKQFNAEIGIVGAGPAGARAAELLAQQGAEVLLWDPKAPWEKPCGGGLPYAAFRTVPELREMIPEARTVDRMRVEVSPDEGFAVPLDRPLYLVSRLDLSRWQLTRARRAGVELNSTGIRSVEPWRGGWRIEGDGGRQWKVHLLLGADGAASLVRRVASPNFRVELAPTRVAYAPGPGTTPDTAVVRFYDGVEGYLWDFPRTDHRSLGIGLLPRTWARPRMDEEVEGYRRSREACVCGSPKRAGAVIGTAQYGHGDYSWVGAENFALLGDAAGFADPATGEGIQNALRSAGLAADAYRADGHFGSYPSRARRTFEREFRMARAIRVLVFDRGMGVRLVKRGVTANWAIAVTAAVGNATNEHDANLLRLLRRTGAAYRRIWREPDEAGREPRRPVPCQCREVEGSTGERVSCIQSHGGELPGLGQAPSVSARVCAARTPDIAAEATPNPGKVVWPA